MSTKEALTKESLLEQGIVSDEANKILSEYEDEVTDLGDEEVSEVDVLEEAPEYDE